MASDDNLIIEDESNATNAARTVSVSLFAASLADGSTITSSNGVLSSAASPLSDDDPADVGETAAEGTGTSASRDDHAHRVPIADTLEWQGDQLAVNDERVTDLLTERIQYNTSISFPDGTSRSCPGQQYGTSAFEKDIHKIKARFGRDEPYYYRATVARVASNSDGTIEAIYGRSNIINVDASAEVHTLRFDPAVELPSVEETIVILVCRTNAAGTGGSSTERVDMIRGSELSTSPSESYDDASMDFDLEQSVWYSESYPEIGEDRHSHDASLVLGNVEIFYTESIHHAARVGLETVNVAHIHSGTATDDQFIGNDGSGSAVWKVPEGGVELSDTDPVSVNIALNDPGTATDASRRDHRHRVDQAGTGTYGVARYATNAEALAATSSSRAITPATLDNIFTDFASTGIGALAGGGHFFDPTEIVGTGLVAQDDSLIIEDESNSTNAARTVTVSLFADFLADGTTITAAAGVLSADVPDADRICPDPTTGTVGQVCAVNTGATSYELVDQTGVSSGGPVHGLRDSQPRSRHGYGVDAGRESGRRVPAHDQTRRYRQFLIPAKGAYGVLVSDDLRDLARTRRPPPPWRMTDAVR